MDTLVAELLERLAGVSNTTDACSTVLDCVLPEAGFGAGVIVVRIETGVHAVGWAVTDEQVTAVLGSAREADSPIVDILSQSYRPELVPASLVPGLRFSSIAAVPIPGFSR